MSAIVTMTRARSPEEAAPLLESLASLAALGLPMYITDAGSIPAFVDAVAHLGNVSLARETGGLVRQVKASIARAVAAGHELLIYTEPDKREFFETHLGNLIDEAQRDRDAAIIIAARDAIGFSTFPYTQQAAERALSTLASDLLGPLPDLLYGPLALRPRIAGNYAELAPDRLGWGWRIYVVARCALTGKKIASFERAFSCPHDQRALDESVYRLEQLGQNIEGLRLALQDFRASAI